MAKKRPVTWLVRPSKPKKPSIPESLKTLVAANAKELVETGLRASRGKRADGADEGRASNTAPVCPVSLDKQHLPISRQRPEVIGDHRFELVAVCS
jgi:hypothetical protein